MTVMVRSFIQEQLRIAAPRSFSIQFTPRIKFSDLLWKNNQKFQIYPRKTLDHRFELNKYIDTNHLLKIIVIFVQKFKHIWTSQ